MKAFARRKAFSSRSIGGPECAIASPTVPPLSVLAKLSLSGIGEINEQTKADMQAEIASHRNCALKLTSPGLK